MARIIKEIALDAPNLVVHLVPFGARINEDLHLIQFKRAVARLWRGFRFGDEPSLSLAVQNFFAIRGNTNSIDSAEECLGLPSRQIKLRYCYRCLPFESRHIHDFGEEKRAGLARVEVHVVGSLDRQSHDSLPDSVEINLDLDWLLLLLAFFTLFAVLAFLSCFSFV